jgi:hypothetical protein
MLTETTLLQLLAIVGSVVIPVTAAVIWITKTMFSWMMKKLDEKNGFQVALTTNTQAVQALAETMHQVQQGQCQIADRMQRLCDRIEKV